MDKSAGDDLKNAILKMTNRIKDKQIYPECLQLCNISSIWKKKGPRNEFDSYRGIFRVTVFRSILDRLIYNDEYSKLKISQIAMLVQERNAISGITSLLSMLS